MCILCALVNGPTGIMRMLLKCIIIISTPHIDISYVDSISELHVTLYGIQFWRERQSCISTVISEQKENKYCFTSLVPQQLHMPTTKSIVATSNYRYTNTMITMKVKPNLRTGLGKTVSVGHRANRK